MEGTDNDVVMDGGNQGDPSAFGFGDLGNPVAGFDDSSPSDEMDESGDTETPLDSIDQEPTEGERREKPTGCCYDDRMKLHANADFGPKPHHPEDPGRIEAIMMKFKKAGLVFTGSDSEYVEVLRKTPTKYMWRIPAREATKSEICNVHLPQHYEWVRALAEKSTEELRHITKIMDAGRDSIYVGSMTFQASLFSAGGAIETCKSVVAGNVKNAFAVIRPPGHHAEYDCPMGFCMFNNVPIAARCCQLDYPETCRKILILDWDVHHGNGIQNIFYNDPNVLYISLHVYQNGLFYPGQPENPDIPDGGPDKCGAEAGIGKNVNIGWHDQGMGDGEYMAAFQKIVMPIAQEFNPDLVIISAGFDAADGDELGACFVTPTCYAHMTHMLMSLAGGKVSVCLEGGYNLRAISDSALAVARTLMGEPPPRMVLPKINKDAAKALARVQAYQAPYWECMRPNIVSVPEVLQTDGKSLGQVLRGYQRHNFLQNHGMCPLYIQREALFRTYENQVLVTQDIDMARHVLVILHDPPELLAQPDPLDNTIEPSNAWVVDGVTRYIDWAASKNFGIMDVNIPRIPEGTSPYNTELNEKQLEAQIQELVCYLWDNYLQLYDDAEEIFIMGVGHAYIGVKMLLLNRDCKSKISGVVNFVNGSLRPIRSDVDERLSAWYKDNSLVYVASDHLCWTDPKLQGKVKKKRFGTVIHSPQLTLNAMMKEHAKEVQGWIAARSIDAAAAQTGDTTEDDKVA
ncbi:Histone deacetylase clr3 [Cytospora mali]|uniref:Histone deacetylase n=1 Tax=Cytospora mali TaxID=578113 RepID=A0A194VE68_CYTMA|nr:Histone deacetylase clr3 [Valsa mali var. pyri (nom. inval.)]